MTISQFKEIARLLKKAYTELEDELLNEGLYPTMPEYPEVFKALQEEVRLAVLESVGFSLEEYKAAKAEAEMTQQIERDAAKKEKEEIKAKINEVDLRHIPTEDEIKDIASKEVEAKKETPKIINKIVKETIKEKPQIIKEKEIVKEIDEDALDDVKEDIQALQESHSELYNRVRELNIPAEINVDELEERLTDKFGEMFEHNIDTLGMPDFRKLAMGLQAQIDELKGPSDGQVDAAGNNTEIQFNDGGILGASSNLTFDGTTLYAEGALTDLSGTSVSNATTTIDTGGSTINDFASYTWQYKARITAYKIVDGIRVFYDQIETDTATYVEGSGDGNYDIITSWDSLSGADGYILEYDGGRVGFTKNVTYANGYYDVGNTLSYSWPKYNGALNVEFFVSSALDASSQSYYDTTIDVLGNVNIQSGSLLFNDIETLTQTVDNNIYLGTNNFNFGSDCTLIGSGNDSFSDNTFIFGRDNTTSYYSLALGIDNIVNGGFGTPDNNYGFGIGIGYNNDTTEGIIIGQNNNGEGGIILGKENVSYKDNTILVGDNIQSGNDYSVIIGYGRDNGYNMSSVGEGILLGTVPSNFNIPNLLGIIDYKVGTFVNKSSYDVELNGETIIEDMINGLGSSLISNPYMTTDTWVKGTGWTKTTSSYEKSSDGTGTLESPNTPTLTVGNRYAVTINIWKLTTGYVDATIGGVSLPRMSADGTYWFTFTALSSSKLVFTPSNTSRFRIYCGDVKEISGGDLTIMGDTFIGGTDGYETIKLDASEGDMIATSASITDVNFDTTNVADPVEGTMNWNSDEETLNIGVGHGSILQVGQEVLYHVKNQTGSDIADGVVVKFAGTVGASGRILIAPFLADNSDPSDYCMGITTGAIANGEDGYVTHFGKVRGIDTTGQNGETWNDGDILYASPTVAGSLTNVEPDAPNNHVTIAAVVHANANGTLFVRNTFAEKLSSLQDVNGTALDTNGQMPIWDNDNGYFDFTYNPLITKDPTGFDRETPASLPTISFDNGTRTLSLGTDYWYYRNGKKITKTTDSVQIDDTEGIWFIYYETDDTLTASQTPWDFDNGKVFVAIVYWDATNNLGQVGDELHGLMPHQVHQYLHQTSGAVYVSGFSPTLTSVDSVADSTDDVTMSSVSAGTFYDEDILHSNAEQTTYEIWYKDGASADWRWDSASSIVVKNGGAGTRPYYNEWTGATWQLTTLGVAKFGLMHIFATNRYSTDEKIILVMGENEYASKNDANDGALTEITSLTTGALPTPEFIPIGTIIIQTGANYGNGYESRVVSTEDGGDFVDFRTNEKIGVGASTNHHGNLSGLGDDDHTQYALADGTRTFDVAELEDVTISSVADGDVLLYNSATGDWENETTATGTFYSYFTLWAEESANTTTNAYEWSWGNGDEAESGSGAIIPVDCELYALSSTTGGADNTFRFEVYKNTVATGAISDSMGGAKTKHTEVTPVSFTAGDIMDFRTYASGSFTAGTRVFAHFRAAQTFTGIKGDQGDPGADGEDGTLNGGGSITLTEQSSTPSTPSTGDHKIYYKTDGVFYQLDDTGTESTFETSGSVPIGGVVAWLKSYTNTPALPSEFVESNGQTLSDGDSVFDGQVIPDLNGYQTGGTQRFLYGGGNGNATATTSGDVGGSALHSHTVTSPCGALICCVNTAAAGADYCLPCYACFTAATCCCTFLPPYYEVVWVMRIK